MARASSGGEGSSGRGPSRQERAQETKQQLLRTASRLWSERGFDAVTVEEICSAAGVGRTTFYLHFDSKERLLRSLASATATGVGSDLAAVAAEEALDLRLDVFVRGVVRRIEAVPKGLAALVIHSQHVQQMKAGLGDGALDGLRFADLLREVLVDARARGELVATVDAAELGEVLGALTMDAIEAWSAGRAGGRQLDPILRARFHLVLDQLRPRRDA